VPSFFTFSTSEIAACSGVFFAPSVPPGIVGWVSGPLGNHFHSDCICLVLLGDSFGPDGAILEVHHGCLAAFLFHLHRLR
jgi:hypothetical protein